MIISIPQAGSLLMAAALSPLVAAAPASYTLTQKDQHCVTVAAHGAGVVDLEMSFCILRADLAPKPENRPLAIDVAYNAPSWHNPLLKDASGSIRQQNDDLSVGDGFDPSIL
ncbi:MAG TPA: hypothetical protein VFY13_09560, partial [Luteolibacter sp.]|nr:hypothetical protein [Luteolibacter sp.]